MGELSFNCLMKPLDQNYNVGANSVDEFIVAVIMTIIVYYLET